MKNIKSDTVVVNDGTMWYVTWDNVLVKTDLKTKVSTVADVKGYKKHPFKNVVDTMLSDGNFLYWIEQDGKRLVIYSLCDGDCEFIEIPEIPYEKWKSTAGFYKVENDLYIVPCFKAEIIIYDLEKKDFKFIKLDKIINETCEINASCCIKNKLYLFEKLKGVLFAVDLFSFDTIELIRLENYVVSCMTYVEDDLYLLLNNPCRVWKYNIKSKEINELWYSETTNSIEFCVMEKDIVIMPSGGEKIIFLSREGHESKILNEYPFNFEWNGNKAHTKYLNHCEDDFVIWYANRCANYHFCIEKRTGNGRWYSVEEMSPQEKMKYYVALGKEYIEEGTVWELKDLIELIDITV